MEGFAMHLRTRRCRWLNFVLVLVVAAACGSSGSTSTSANSENSDAIPTTGGPDSQPLSAEDQKAADELAANMKHDFKQQFDLNDNEIQCLAEGQVAMSDRLASWTATPGPTREERKAIATDYVDMQIRCSDHWKLMFVDYRMPGPHADAVSKKSRECVANTLDNDQARFMWISEMSGEHTPDVERPFLAALQECLTGKELGGLDLGS